MDTHSIAKRLPQTLWASITWVGLLICAPAYAEQAHEVTATPLGDGIYMLQGRGGNLGLSVGADGVFMIDDDFPQLAGAIRAKVKEIAGQDVDYLVNTHWHGDHSGGNLAFASFGAHILAHDNVRMRMGAEGPRQSPPAALPKLTYSDTATLHYNGHEVHLFHVQRAHTDGDTIVHFRNQNIIHTGDVLFNGLYPFIDLDSGGTVQGYIEALTLIENLSDDATQIIPGHGPMADKADISRTIAMLRNARQAVKSLFDQGQSMGEVHAADPLQPFHDTYSWGFINGARFTETLYRDLEAQ